MAHLNLWLGFVVVGCLFVCAAFLLVSVGGVFDAWIDPQCNGNVVPGALQNILNEKDTTEKDKLSDRKHLREHLDCL